MHSKTVYHNHRHLYRRHARKFKNFS